MTAHDKEGKRDLIAIELVSARVSERTRDARITAFSSFI